MYRRLSLFHAPLPEQRGGFTTMGIKEKTQRTKGLCVGTSVIFILKTLSPPEKLL